MQTSNMTQVNTQLIKPIADGKADVVYGSRFIGGTQSPLLLALWGIRCLL